ncbi:MAG: hypothetical protein K8T10_02755 [Candidatus Eremiobacteraeota bacterium]|nr:hypothetical protein [Candidatus Eremiobacteraeota bacterium]
MNVLTSIKHKLHIGREIPIGKNNETGETGAQINTQDKVSLSSGSDEEKTSMSLKDAATSGGVGFAIGLGVGNNGRIKNLENEMNTMKSGEKLGPPMTMEDGKEPSVTPREMKALKMISRQAFRDEFIYDDSAGWGVISGAIGALPGLMVATAFPAIGLGIIGASVLTGVTIAGCSSGRTAAKQARKKWLGKFGNQSEAESMKEFNKGYPELWLKMLKKG